MISLIILLLALGAFMSAIVPLIVAGAGLITALGVLAGLNEVMSFGSVVVTIATAFGLGVGIDSSSSAASARNWPASATRLHPGRISRRRLGGPCARPDG
ncbi:MMPL family protein [Nocardia pseudobrasiliensis]|uniref:MMPL family protein n=1 Tax=Nocardia pseudobrasiliensis TaxID=45979 RepID=A0A370ID92_9NOCA|nr:MMPL family protein [Nocardia pseudobrasiliensis]